MYKESRQRKIQELVERHNHVSVDDLSEAFGVSKMTIRRDLQLLHHQNSVERTHGGAITTKRPSRFFEPELLERINTLSEEKKTIASFVAHQIPSGATLYLSGGTTVFYIAQALCPRDDITIVTNSLVTAGYIAKNSDMKLGVLGGYLRRGEFVLYGEPEKNNLSGFPIDQVIIGCRGVHPFYGITSDIVINVSSDLSVIEHFKKIMVVTDHTKIGHVALTKLAPIDSNLHLITSTLAPLAVIDALRDGNARVDLVSFNINTEQLMNKIE
ncbi:MAG: DeoR/GlpR transcriptional regulator [Anaerolineaceae bacterium]|nr:DeoR/GlpR transcriptional regulator [Anaerolineaceae bacterium]